MVAHVVLFSCVLLLQMILEIVVVLLVHLLGFNGVLVLRFRAALAAAILNHQVAQWEALHQAGRVHGRVGCSGLTSYVQHLTEAFAVSSYVIA